MNRNLTSLALTLACALIAVADEPAVLFKNVMVFDGKSDKLSDPTSVLVVGNKIAAIGTDLVSLGKASVIDGVGWTFILGLIDAHTQLAMAAVHMSTLMLADVGYLHQQGTYRKSQIHRFRSLSRVLLHRA